MPKYRVKPEIKFHKTNINNPLMLRTGKYIDSGSHIFLHYCNSKGSLGTVIESISIVSRMINSPSYKVTFYPNKNKLYKICLNDN